MTLKPVIYLDFDGCINFFGTNLSDFEDKETGEAFLPPKNKTYPLQWSPALVQELNNLDVEIVWLTTWREYAVTTLAPLIGLNASTFLNWGKGYNDHQEWGKYIALINDQKENPRPFIWVDDNATEYYYLDLTRSKNLEEHLIVTPYLYTGITSLQLNKIKEFITKLPR